MERFTQPEPFGQAQEVLRMTSDDQRHHRELSAEELDAQEAAELPDREAMSLINANIAIPVNAAVAANVLSDNAVAYADATQDSVIDQTTGGATLTQGADGQDVSDPIEP
jgi:hypothetical protein